MKWITRISRAAAMGLACVGSLILASAVSGVGSAVLARALNKGTSTNVA